MWTGNQWSGLIKMYIYAVDRSNPDYVDEEVKHKGVDYRNATGWLNCCWSEKSPSQPKRDISSLEIIDFIAFNKNDERCIFIIQQPVYGVFWKNLKIPFILCILYLFDQVVEIKQFNVKNWLFWHIDSWSLRTDTFVPVTIKIVLTSIISYKSTI